VRKVFLYIEFAFGAVDALFEPFADALIVKNVFAR
jgi:hypothetical protein